jgi:hypothetical protein
MINKGRRTEVLGCVARRLILGNTNLLTSVVSLIVHRFYVFDGLF